jgi:hypothetical protein
MLEQDEFCRLMAPWIYMAVSHARDAVIVRHNRAEGFYTLAFYLNKTYVFTDCNGFIRDARVNNVACT